VVVTLTDAGHILGSASITVKADGQTAAFSGDLGTHLCVVIDWCWKCMAD